MFWLFETAKAAEHGEAAHETAHHTPIVVELVNHYFGQAAYDFEIHCAVVSIFVQPDLEDLAPGLGHVVDLGITHMDRRGYILPIASLAAALHMPLMAHYAATKAGVEAFADSLRGEVAHTGTKVGVAYFSFIGTDMVQESFEQVAGADEPHPVEIDQLALDSVRGRTPPILRYGK